MGFLVVVVSRIGWVRVFKTFVWGRWVFAMGLREEQEKVCLLGFLGFFFFLVICFPRKFIGLWVCWRLVYLLGLWV